MKKGRRNKGLSGGGPGLKEPGGIVSEAQVEVDFRPPVKLPAGELDRRKAVPHVAGPLLISDVR